MPDWNIALKSMFFVVTVFLLCGVIYAVMGGKGKDKNPGN